MSGADDRLRAVKAALAEREHLLRVKSTLGIDVFTEQRRVQELQAELQSERDDVVRMTTGVMGFLTGILGGEEALSKEKREAAEAEARLREAVGSLEMMRQQAAAVDARLARLVPAELERELRAVTAAREATLIEQGTPTGATLQELAIQLESIDIELVPLEDAVVAGNAALATLAQIVVACGAALAGGLTRDDATKARGIAGEAQAQITVFARSPGEPATSTLDDPLATPASLDEPPFADPWIRALFGPAPAIDRITAAHASMVQRLERVRAIFAPIHARYEELAARRAALVRERDRLLG